VNEELRAVIERERAHVVEQLEALRESFAAIVAGTELTSTDDEHDPEGTTIAYERAQVSALLHQAEQDLAALDQALQRLDDGSIFVCAKCGGPIPEERLLILPTTRYCVRCAG
jgi:RNA polymerase-binding transcription factor DksA